MFSTTKVIERLNALISKFEEDPKNNGELTSLLGTTLYWIKYGMDQPNPEIQKQVDKMFLDYKSSKEDRNE